MAIKRIPKTAVILTNLFILFFRGLSNQQTSVHHTELLPDNYWTKVQIGVFGPGFWLSVKVCHAWNGKDEKKLTHERNIIIDLHY
jgi:hypothetical protein